MSAKSVADKLLIKPSTTIWMSHQEKLDLIEGMPEQAGIVDRPADATLALVFAESAAAARDILDAHKDDLTRPATFWVAYPKANRADINRDSLWPILTEYGMRPIAQVAIDDTWSALRFRPLKEGEEPFSGGRSSTGTAS